MADPSVILDPVLNYAVDTVATAVGIVAVWAIGIVGHKVAQLFDIKGKIVLVGQLQEAVPRAVALAEAKGHQVVTTMHPATLNISNPIERMAASYLLKQFPNLVKKLGMSPEQVGDYVKAWLARRDSYAGRVSSGNIGSQVPVPAAASAPASFTGDGAGPTVTAP